MRDAKAVRFFLRRRRAPLRDAHSALQREARSRDAARDRPGRGALALDLGELLAQRRNGHAERVALVAQLPARCFGRRAARVAALRPARPTQLARARQRARGERGTLALQRAHQHAQLCDFDEERVEFGLADLPPQDARGRGGGAAVRRSRVAPLGAPRGAHEGSVPPRAAARETWRGGRGGEHGDGALERRRALGEISRALR